MPVRVIDLSCEGVPLLQRRLVDAGSAGGDGGGVAHPHGVPVRGVNAQHALASACWCHAPLASDLPETARGDQHQAHARAEAELQRFGDAVVCDGAEGVETEPVSVEGKRATPIGGGQADRVVHRGLRRQVRKELIGSAVFGALQQ
jgi:hypothetical protein